MFGQWDIGLHCVCMARAFLAACLGNLWLQLFVGQGSSGTMGGVAGETACKGTDNHWWWEWDWAWWVLWPGRAANHSLKAAGFPKGG